jgi:lambda repressor-like predicted transcriptional regulator
MLILYFMDKHEYVLVELKNRKWQLGIVAMETGLSRRTLKNILQEKFEPRHSTVEKLYEYLKANSRKKLLEQTKEK